MLGILRQYLWSPQKIIRVGVITVPFAAATCLFPLSHPIPVRLTSQSPAQAIMTPRLPHHHGLMDRSILIRPARASIPAAVPHALWVWHTTDIQTAPESLLHFAQQHQVTTLYLQYRPNLAPALYATFIQSATADHLRVYATGGAPAWALPSHRSSLTQFIRHVAQYNQTASFSARFTGVDLDIEGYLLPQWSSQSRLIERDFAMNIQSAAQHAHYDHLVLDGTLPFWYPPSAALPIVHTFTNTEIMAYRQQALGPQGIIALMQPWTREPILPGHTITVAFNTTASVSDPATSFAGTSEHDLLQQRALTMHALQFSPLIQGWALNSYASWKQLTSSS